MVTKLLHEVLSEIKTEIIFPTLKEHASETTDGIDNHYITTVHLICRKYLELRSKKVLKDRAIQRRLGKDGSAMDRTRIFTNS